MDPRSPPRKKSLVQQAHEEDHGSQNESNKYLALSVFANQIRNHVALGTIRQGRRISARGSARNFTVRMRQFVNLTALSSRNLKPFPGHAVKGRFSRKFRRAPRRGGYFDRRTHRARKKTKNIALKEQSPIRRAKRSVPFRTPADRQVPQFPAFRIARPCLLLPRFATTRILSNAGLQMTGASGCAAFLSNTSTQNKKRPPVRRPQNR